MTSSLRLLELRRMHKTAQRLERRARGRHDTDETGDGKPANAP